MRIFINKKKKSDEESYWQSSTDMMVGLLLVLILLIALLLLLLARRNDHRYPYDETVPYSVTTQDDDEDESTTHREDYTRAEETTTRPYQDGGGDGEPQTTGHDEPYDDFGKTAVLVAVIDEETGNVIKQSGILFELYADQDKVTGLQALYTYYPHKIEYKQYETTESGTFYLPEKIWDGWYSLHNLTAPEKYEPGSVTKFEITETRDWNDPYLVSVPLSPAKNTIKINAVDSVTKAPVAGGVYEIVAEPDVILLDGTIRLNKGDVADTITTDEKGFAQSKPLYLGNYRIRQKTASEFYAVMTDPILTEVKKTDETETPVTQVLCDKTEFVYTLTDVFDGTPIPDAVFTQADGKELKTDADGRIVLTDLTKGTTYTLTLQTLPKPFRPAKLNASFTVDAKGYIHDQAKYNATGTAYTIRLSAYAADRLLKQEVDGINLTLYDSKDQVVRNWDTDGTGKIIEGLEPGTYKLEIAGRKSTRITVDVKNTAEVQKGIIYMWTVLDFVLIIVGAAVLAAAVLIAVRVIRKRKKGKIDG